MGLNLLMALGAIWIFMRMAPAIEIILYRNARSLHASEQMLSFLAMADDREGEDFIILKDSFSESLRNAQNNITEEGEPLTLERIGENYKDAFQGDREARNRTVAAILQLGDINRSAMAEADRRARQLGNAGAWGIVFMATIVFFSGMLFIRSISKRLIQPLEEIHAVITAHRGGDRMRRCTGANLPKDIKIIFTGINEYLDKNASQYTPEQIKNISDVNTDPLVQ